MKHEKYHLISAMLTEAEEHLQEAEKLTRGFTEEIRTFHRQKALKKIQDAKTMLWARGFLEDYHSGESAEMIAEAVALLRAAQDLDVKHCKEAAALQKAGIARALSLLEGLPRSDGGGLDDADRD